ncbi:MAG TPA: hypothetical protein DCM07_28905 [Planctomycetaceae bacterium]|nr:hypothetical protein [Gimesia sp.]HAH48788.1 hypothetical protein [Planctomycetaceae bacterium]HBL42675.1 hypothetical protein [Planctomycetaceae bacterium]
MAPRYLDINCTVPYQLRRARATVVLPDGTQLTSPYQQNQLARDAIRSCRKQQETVRTFSRKPGEVKLPHHIRIKLLDLAADSDYNFSIQYNSPGSYTLKSELFSRELGATVSSPTVCS